MNTSFPDCIEGLLNVLSGSTGHRAFLDNDLVIFCHCSNHASCCFHVDHVCGTASSCASGLGRSGYAEEDEICCCDGSSDVCREEEVGLSDARDAIACWLKDLKKARLVNGKVIGVPGIDAFDVEVDDGDFDVRAFVRSHSTCRASLC